MITYETLKSFCSNDRIIEQLNFVCKRGQGLWATDYYKIIYVPFDECQQFDKSLLLDEEKIGRFPDLERMIYRFVPECSISTKAIEDALNKLQLVEEYEEVQRKIKYIECPGCCGTGKVEINDTVFFNEHYYDVEDTVECPICHGCGKIPDIDDYDPYEDEYDPEQDSTYYTNIKTGKKIPDIECTLLHIKETGYFKSKYAIDLLRVAREQGVTELEYSYYNKAHLFRMNGVIVGIMSYFNDDKKKQYVDINL